MKKAIIIISAILVLSGGYWLAGGYIKSQPPSQSGASQCSAQELTFYYLENCGWCRKVESDGTLDKLEKLGVKVKKINAAVGPIRDKFSSTPTFVIRKRVYEGYKTFEEIKRLLGCPDEVSASATGTSILAGKAASSQGLIEAPAPAKDKFIGQKGDKVFLENGEARLDASTFNDGQAHFYNVEMPAVEAGSPGKTVYFFAVKDKNGILRAAANGCQVCYGAHKGFHQDGAEMVCDNCGNRYPIEKIATEKGGCNPAPVSPDLEVRDGKVIIKQVELEGVAGLF